MDTASSDPIDCFVCQEGKVTYKCKECLKDFCKTHTRGHEDHLQLQLDGIQNETNIFKQSLAQQIQRPNQQQLIEQINQWEQISIEKIRQVAQENRQLVVEQMNEHFEKIEIDLDCFTDQVEQIRHKNDFNEIHLNDLKQKLEQLQKQLNQPKNFILKEEKNSSSFINKIYVHIEHQMLNIPSNLKWKQNANTIAGGYGEGGKMNQLSRPWSISIDNEKTIYVADSWNDRIVSWKKDSTIGRIVAGGNGKGNQMNQLDRPTKVIIDEINDCFIIADYGNNRVVRWPRQNGEQGQTIINNVSCFDLILHKNEYLYVCDNEKDEVRRWKLDKSQGVLVAGGNEKGNNLNQLNNPHFVVVGDDETIYVSDNENDRVMKWVKGAKEGIIVAGGQGQGNSLNQLSYPEGIFVDRLGTLYVSDGENNRIVRWKKGAKEGEIIAGGNNEGNQSNQLNDPMGLSFDSENNLYVADHYSHRIQKFLVDN